MWLNFITVLIIQHVWANAIQALICLCYFARLVIQFVRLALTPQQTVLYVLMAFTFNKKNAFLHVQKVTNQILTETVFIVGIIVMLD